MKEIENVDRALCNQGFVDVSIGNVGLERLKKTARTAQVAQTIPSLLYIIPYFEISANQEYVVQRIRGITFIIYLSYNLYIFDIFNIAF